MRDCRIQMRGTSGQIVADAWPRCQPPKDAENQTPGPAPQRVERGPVRSVRGSCREFEVLPVMTRKTADLPNRSALRLLNRRVRRAGDSSRLALAGGAVYPRQPTWPYRTTRALGSSPPSSRSQEWFGDYRQVAPSCLPHRDEAHSRAPKQG
jgi:hypothetical protein